MNTHTRMLVEGWKFEGLAFKFDNQKPIIEEIEPWRTICITLPDENYNLCSVWSRDDVKEGLQKK